MAEKVVPEHSEAGLQQRVHKFSPHTRAGPYAVTEHCNALALSICDGLRLLEHEVGYAVPAAQKESRRVAIELPQLRCVSRWRSIHKGRKRGILIVI